jgi:hypothetical protein
LGVASSLGQTRRYSNDSAFPASVGCAATPGTLNEEPSVQVLTFDFHNTLANCDRWFQLEIRDLPWAVMQQLELTDGHVQQTIEESIVNSGWQSLKVETRSTPQRLSK